MEPLAVLQTAVTATGNGTTLSYTWQAENRPAYSFMVFLHFADFQNTQPRQFYVYLNGNRLGLSDKPYSPQYLASSTVSNSGWYRAIDGVYNITLVAAAVSVLPPILNAIEIYTLLVFDTPTTFPDDCEFSHSQSPLLFLSLDTYFSPPSVRRLGYHLVSAEHFTARRPPWHDPSCLPLISIEQLAGNSSPLPPTPPNQISPAARWAVHSYLVHRQQPVRPPDAIGPLLSPAAMDALDNLKPWPPSPSPRPPSRSWWTRRWPLHHYPPPPSSVPATTSAHVAFVSGACVPDKKIGITMGNLVLYRCQSRWSSVDHIVWHPIQRLQW